MVSERKGDNSGDRTNIQDHKNDKLDQAPDGTKVRNASAADKQKAEEQRTKIWTTDENKTGSKLKALKPEDITDPKQREAWINGPDLKIDFNDGTFATGKGKVDLRHLEKKPHHAEKPAPGAVVGSTDDIFDRDFKAPRRDLNYLPFGTPDDVDIWKVPDQAWDLMDKKVNQMIIDGKFHKHVVKPGENLEDISKQVYGTRGRWAEIFLANKSDMAKAQGVPYEQADPRKIHAGQVIYIPKDADPKQQD